MPGSARRVRPWAAVVNYWAASTRRPGLTQGLVRLGTTLRELTGVVAPTAGLIEALEDKNALLAFANGLGVVSGGARALANPDGAFSDTAPGVDLVFDIDKETRERLKTIAQGTGVASFVARAIDAADRGDSFRTASFLAAAVQQLNDPKTTVLGDRAQIVQRIADIGATLERVHGSGNPLLAGRAAAPIVIAQLGQLVDDVSTPPKLRSRTEPAAGPALVGPVPAAAPARSRHRPLHRAPPGVGWRSGPRNVRAEPVRGGARAGSAHAGRPAELVGLLLPTAPADFALPPADPDELVSGGTGRDTLLGGAGDDVVAEGQMNAFAAAGLDVPAGMSLSTDPAPELPAAALPGLPIPLPAAGQFATIRPRTESNFAPGSLRALHALGQLPPPGIDLDLSFDSSRSKSRSPVAVKGGEKHTVTQGPDGETMYTGRERLGYSLSNPDPRQRRRRTMT